MKLLLFNTDLEIGGTPTVVRELARRLPEHGVETAVACLAGPFARPVSVVTAAAVWAGAAVIAVVAVKLWRLSDRDDLPRTAAGQLRGQAAAFGLLAILATAAAVACGAALRTAPPHLWRAIPWAWLLPAAMTAAAGVLWGAWRVFRAAARRAGRGEP